jgi:hypothetical protein
MAPGAKLLVGSGGPSHVGVGNRSETVSLTVSELEGQPAA